MRNYLLKRQAVPRAAMSLCSCKLLGLATAGCVQDIHYLKKQYLLIFLSIVDTGNTISLPVQYEKRTSWSYGLWFGHCVRHLFQQSVLQLKLHPRTLGNQRARCTPLAPNAIGPTECGVEYLKENSEWGATLYRLFPCSHCGWRVWEIHAHRNGLRWHKRKVHTAPWQCG